MLKKSIRGFMALLACGLLATVPTACSGGGEDGDYKVYATATTELDVAKFLDGQAEFFVNVPNCGIISYICDSKTGDTTGTGRVTFAIPSARLVYQAEFTATQVDDAAEILVKFTNFLAGQSQYVPDGTSSAIKKYLRVDRPERLGIGTGGYAVEVSMELFGGACSVIETLADEEARFYDPDTFFGSDNNNYTDDSYIYLQYPSEEATTEWGEKCFTGKYNCIEAT